MLWAGAVQASASCNQMRSWLRQGGGSASGLVVVDVETGKTVCAASPGRQRPLASNMKLFTTSTVLSRLGPETRIPTKVFRDGPIDSHGVLHGSLYLQGGGDPALGTEARTWRDGCATRDAYGVSAGLTPVWYRVFSGTDLLLPVSAVWTLSLIHI